MWRPSCCAALLAALLVGCAEKADELTFYPVECSVPFDQNECHGKLKASATEKLYVDRAHQRVILLSSFGPIPLENCTVFDVENWRCGRPLSEGGLVSRSMKGGRYEEVLNYDQPARLKYVSRWEWWNAKLNE